MGQRTHNSVYSETLQPVKACVRAAARLCYWLQMCKFVGSWRHVYCCKRPCVLASKLLSSYYVQVSCSSLPYVCSNHTIYSYACGVNKCECKDSHFILTLLLAKCIFSLYDVIIYLPARLFAFCIHSLLSTSQFNANVSLSGWCDVPPVTGRLVSTIQREFSTDQVCTDSHITRNARVGEVEWDCRDWWTSKQVNVCNIQD